MKKNLDLYINFSKKFLNKSDKILKQNHRNLFNIIVGPGTISMAHQTNEFVKKSEIIKSKKIYEHLINELC